jgi:hypothetical protein
VILPVFYYNFCNRAAIINDVTLSKTDSHAFTVGRNSIFNSKTTEIDYLSGTGSTNPEKNAGNPTGSLHF